MPDFVLCGTEECIEASKKLDKYIILIYIAHEGYVVEFSTELKPLAMKKFNFIKHRNPNTSVLFVELLGRSH